MNQTRTANMSHTTPCTPMRAITAALLLLTLSLPAQAGDLTIDGNLIVTSNLTVNGSVSGITAAQVGAVDVTDTRYLTALTNADAAYAWGNHATNGYLRPATEFPSVAVENGREWRGIASSADGTKLVACVRGGQLYTSTDSGITWTARESVRDWWCVASSSDGTKLVAGDWNGQLYTSTDSGVTWTARASYGNWWCVASSADGTKLVAGASGDGIYTSTDSGITWTRHLGGNSWKGVASSADGTKMVACGDMSYFFTSTDSGVTWTKRGSNLYWGCIASSADGTKLVAGAEFGQLYTSTDSGVTWTKRESNRGWSSVASSADGTKLVASVDGGQLYTSADSGITWTARESNRRWSGVASTADGTRLAGVARDEQIYLMSFQSPDILLPANLIPATSNTVSLGSASTPLSSVYAGSLFVGGTTGLPLNVNGNAAISGTLSVGTLNVNNGLTVAGPVTGITAAQVGAVANGGATINGFAITNGAAINVNFKKLVQNDNTWLEMSNGVAVIRQVVFPPPSPLSSTGLVAYYPLNGNATDQSGNGNDGSLGGNILTTTGVAGECFDFDGNSAVVNCPNLGSYFSANGTISMCAWVNLSRGYKANGFTTFIVAMDTGIGIGARTALQISTNGVPFLINCGTLWGEGVLYSTSGSLSPSQWHFVASVQSGTVARLYVDGVLSAASDSFVPLRENGWGYPTTIGYWNNWYGRPETAFAGLIDEVSLYNRALSAEEIASYYQSVNGIITASQIGDLATTDARYLTSLSNIVINGVLGSRSGSGNNLLSSLTLSAAQVGAVATNNTRYLAALTNAAAFDAAGAAAVVQAQLPAITNSVTNAMIKAVAAQTTATNALQIANAKLSPSGSGSALTGITAAQVGAVTPAAASNIVQTAFLYVPARGDISMGSYTNAP